MCECYMLCSLLFNFSHGSDENFALLVYYTILDVLLGIQICADRLRSLTESELDVGEYSLQLINTSISGILIATNNSSHL